MWQGGRDITNGRNGSLVSRLPRPFWPADSVACQVRNFGLRKMIQKRKTVERLEILNRESRELAFCLEEMDWSVRGRTVRTIHLVWLAICNNQKRAMSVKNYLVNVFAIEPSRLEQGGRKPPYWMKLIQITV